MNPDFCSFIIAGRLPHARHWILALLISSLTTALPVSAASGRSGHLDPHFGNGGVVTTPIQGHDFANSVAIQPDGKIVAAGSSNLKFAVVRYNRDGTVDSTFGAGGVVITSFERSSG